jgi:hypothetical protein
MDSVYPRAVLFNEEEYVGLSYYEDIVSSFLDLNIYKDFGLTLTEFMNMPKDQIAVIKSVATNRIERLAKAQQSLSQNSNSSGNTQKNKKKKNVKS